MENITNIFNITILFIIAVPASVYVLILSWRWLKAWLYLPKFLLKLMRDNVNE
jgi:phosphatidylglycerophosphate synthase